VEKKNLIDVVELRQVFRDLDINYIDWFKSDTQGTDLRLFKSLESHIQDKTIFVELEPGFIDAYKGEDKISDVLNYIDKTGTFFLLNFRVKGPLRMPNEIFQTIFRSKFSKKIAINGFKYVPGWAEIAYMNKLKIESDSPREFVLAWLFSTLKRHHEIAYMYAYRGSQIFPNEPFFKNLTKYSERQLNLDLFSSGTVMRILKKYSLGNFF
jgi:hypothetical protein